MQKYNKEFWDNIASNPTKFQKMFFALTEFKRCIYCKKKYPEGIINKRPFTNRTQNAYDLFTSDFLVHVQTTHGYPPETLTEFITEICK